MPAGLSKGLAPNQVLSGLDEVFHGTMSPVELPQMAQVTDEAVFRQGSTDRGGVITEQMMDSGLWEERSEQGNLAEGSTLAGNKKTYTVTNFAKSLEIPKHFFDDEQYDTVNKSVARMGMKGRITQMKNAFATYRNAFTTAVTNEGTALASDSHTNLNGDTIDNLITTALSESSLNDALNVLVEQKDQKGDNVGYNANCLLVPNRLYKTAAEILDSKLRSGTGNNDMNVYSEKYGIILKQSNWIGATNGGSDTAWFLLAQDHPVQRWKRKDLETWLVDHKYASNLAYIYKAEFREVYGAITYEGLVASTGAA